MQTSNAKRGDRATARPRLSPWLIPLGILLLAAGCGDSSSIGIAQARENGVPRGGEIDPCTVLAKEDIKATLGLQLAEIKYESFPRPKCRYGLGPDEGAIVVYVFADSSASGSFNIGRRMQDVETQALPGIGDDAYWSPSVSTLNVLKGSVYVSLTFLSVKSVSSPAIKTLGQKVASRLS